MMLRKLIQRRILLFVAAIINSAALAQDNFSLGDGGVDGGANSAPINDLEEKSDLFGDMPVNGPAADTKSTIVPSPSSNGLAKSASGSPVAVPASKVAPAPSSGLGFGDLNSKNQTAPSQAILPTSQTSAKSTGTLATDEGLKKQAGPAPLVGDGSLAPVKLEQKIMPNDFGGIPPMAGTRRQMAPGEAPEYYGVEEGDTMFDVCSQLIDDGNYWPKLWSLNPDVKNPHFIYPGMRLAFYSGDEETPPYLEVVAEDEVVPIEKGPVKEAELVSQSVAEEGNPGGSETKVNIMVNDAPTEIVGPGGIGADGDGLDGFIFAGRNFSSDSVNFSVPAFYFESERTPLGQVIGGNSGERMRGDGDRVILEPFSGLGIGTYTILRPQGPALNRVTGSAIGFRYDFAGNVRVIKQNRSGLMEGIVFGVRNGIVAGDIVVNFIATKRVVSQRQTPGPLNTANSSVLGFNETGKNVGGLGDLVFLDKEGLSVGSSYAIYRKESTRDIGHLSRKDLASDGFGVAVVKVLELNGVAALGYIVSGNSEVRVGDSLAP